MQKINKNSKEKRLIKEKRKRCRCTSPAHVQVPSTELRVALAVLSTGGCSSNCGNTCYKLKSLMLLTFFFSVSTRLIKLILNCLFDKMHSLNPCIL